MPSARPGQFLHIAPDKRGVPAYVELASNEDRPREKWTKDFASPFLRRAFSIAGLRRNGDYAEADLIYRVVGAGTRWMYSLKPSEFVDALGPLGNVFPISETKPIAWLVAGGVGLPPMLWLAEALTAAGKRSVAFCGSQTADLLALTLDDKKPPGCDARTATHSAKEFTSAGVPVVISTDDGSLAFRGHIGAAMAAYHQAAATAVQDIVVYTCGPERMMEFVAAYCMERSIECYACMERSMACGIGTCQSCVVPVHDAADPEGWTYRLCCTQGPVFDAKEIIWGRDP